MNAKLSRENVLSTGKKILGLAGPASLALLCAGLARAQSTPTLAGSAPRHTAAASQNLSAKQKGQSQGIRIHGHWVLEVKNPDGKVVERREFENSLVAGSGLNTTSGDQVFAALLSGSATPGGLGVAFITGPTTTAGIDSSSFCNGNNPAHPPTPAGIQCFQFIPSSNSALADGNNAVASTAQTGLTNTVSFSPTVNIVLSGSYLVPAALGTLGSVSAVQTYVGLCYPGSTPPGDGWRMAGTGPFSPESVAPNACTPSLIQNAVNSNVLTSYNIPGSLAVTTGQTIAVTVTLSFS
jgi:hypothetical protein